MYENTEWNVSLSNFRTMGSEQSYQKLPERGKDKTHSKNKESEQYHISTFPLKNRRQKEQCLQNSEKNISKLKIAIYPNLGLSTKHQSKTRFQNTQVSSFTSSTLSGSLKKWGPGNKGSNKEGIAWKKPPGYPGWETCAADLELKQSRSE